MNRSVITQEIHVIKRVLGENVIDTILKEIKNTIKDVPKRKPETEPLSLHMISDVLYDNEGTCRLIDFKQFGTIYIAKVFDKTSENPYVFLAYSIYDLIETFNNTKKSDPLQVQYIKLYETKNDVDYIVSAVDSPKSHFDNCDCCIDNLSLNEIGKYKVRFNEAEEEVIVDVICNPHTLSVSNRFETVRSENIIENIVGSVTLKLYDGQPDIVLSYCNDKSFNKTIGELLTNEDRDRINAVNTITGWVDIDDVDRIQVIQLDTQLLKNGSYVYNAVIEDLEPIPVVEEWTTEYVKDFHAGTADYGNSSDEIPVNQNVNQDKITIQTIAENGLKTVNLIGKKSELAEWLSTNPNQRDSVHKWYALDMVFDPEDLSAGLSFGTIELTPDVLDAAEGENTLTLWLKIDDIENNPRVVNINSSIGDDTETFVIKFINQD